jgi:hypothetical protein
VVLLLAGHNAWHWLVQRASPDTDILALLPSARNDVVLQRAFTHMVDSAQQKVVVLVGGRDWEHAQQGADAYLSSLLPHTAWLAPMAGDTAQMQAQWLDVFGGSRALLLTDEQRAQLPRPRHSNGASRHWPVSMAASAAPSWAPAKTTPSACSPAGYSNAPAKPGATARRSPVRGARWCVLCLAAAGAEVPGLFHGDAAPGRRCWPRRDNQR